MGAMKTPGVYIVEKNAFPNSVVEVATAVPAFIGHTQKAETRAGKKDLKMKPWRISSMVEFMQYYGVGPEPLFTVAQLGGGEGDDAAASDVPADFSFGSKEFSLKQTGGNYTLFNAMQLFFQNGGGPCYVVSVGDYTGAIKAQNFTDGIETLVKEQEPTMVVMPEAVLLDHENCISVQQAALAHCGDRMKNRVTILDIHKGYRDRKDLAADADKGEAEGSCIDNFRNALGINHLKYSAAYYPWVNTTIVQDADLGYENFDDDSKKLLQDLIKEEKGITGGDDDDPKAAALAPEVEKLTQADLAEEEKPLLNTTLRENSMLFKFVLEEMKHKLNLMPPSAAMAGIYTMVDNARGVWKAPANVSLSSVVSPAVNITHEDQEDLNVTPQGKSINAIRTFIGEGTLVWGGRTLDGNSLDWRYIQVRRTMIMLEESIKLAAKAYVFENNVANTWVTIKSMIKNFLTGIWKRGGLAGSSPEDAFSVHVGLGETMTPEDILEGILRVTVLVALVRPAEFIEITFQQQMQKS
jgi:phage tail sheath protein FI